MPDHSVRVVSLILLFALLMGFGIALAFSSSMLPVDFVSTFYPAANYLLRDADVYAGDYTFPPDGTQHPPYNPIWILYAAVPLSVLPVQVAGAVRFLIDLASLPLLAYLCARWAGLNDLWRWLLLPIAPWFSILLYSGQWAGLAVIGTLLCFWRAQRANASLLSVGILLSPARPNMTELVILASIIMAWRSGILLKTRFILMVWVVIFSLQQPTWMMGLMNLYVERFIHPRPADSLLLLPAWPWAQFVLLAIGVIFLIAYLWRTGEQPRSTWFWAVLVCLGLVSALHEYTYDWIILMLPLAWLLRDWRAIFLVIGIYTYPFLWPLPKSTDSFALPSPVVIPSIILISMFVWRIMLPSRQQAVE